MKKGATKEQLVKNFAETVKLTRAEVADLQLLDDETVRIIYEDGGVQSVNIACDSGMGIIRDIARAIQ